MLHMWHSSGLQPLQDLVITWVEPRKARLTPFRPNDGRKGFLFLRKEQQEQQEQQDVESKQQRVPERLAPLSGTRDARSALHREVESY